MFEGKGKTVSEYLAALPPERRDVVAATRQFVRQHLPKGYAEEVNWGAITWVIPLSKFPDTYNKQPLVYAALAGRSSGVSLYLMGIYGDSTLAKEFEATWKRSGKKLKRGKSCINYKSMDDLALDAVRGVIAASTPDEYIHRYVMSRAVTAGARQARAPKGKGPASRRAPAKSK